MNETTETDLKKRDLLKTLPLAPAMLLGGGFARGEAHISGIEGFGGCAKSRLAKFRGMSKRAFYLHLKEREFRLNHRHEEEYEILLDSCRKMPIKLS